jgi:hypothetical protein
MFSSPLSYRLDIQESGIDFWSGQEICFLFTASVQASGTNQAPIQWIAGLFPRG